MKEKKPTPLLQKIFDLRKAKGISLAELGKCLGNITNSGASSIENGEVPLQAEYLPAVAKLLEVESWELWVNEKSGEVGILKEDEKKLVLHFRQLETEEKRKAIQKIVSLLAKK